MTHITQPVLSVLELFKGPLAAMRFGDVDAEALAALTSNVEGAGVEVAAAEAKLSELRQRLALEQEALLALAQRALSYARVYAESHEELLPALNGISLGRLAKPRKAGAAKPADAQGTSRIEPLAAGTELTGTTEPVEAREVELDAEPTDLEARAPSARKSRRSRQSATDVHGADEGARAPE